AVTVKFDIPVNPASVRLVNVQTANDANNTGPQVLFNPPTSPDGGTTLIFTTQAGHGFQKPTSGAPLLYRLQLQGTGGTTNDQILPDQTGATNGAGNPLPNNCTAADLADILNTT